MRAVVHPFGLGVNSYNRMQVVLQNYGLLQRDEWFAQLGEAWPSCDDVWRHKNVLRAVLSKATRAQLDLMMDPPERARWAALPERVDVWRGCYEINRVGLSWTLDREVAARMPTLNRYRGNGVPILRRGQVRKERIVLKLDRDESEVIATRVFAIEES